MDKRAFLVCGLGYGDEGKGATTDWLCHRYEARLVVRYNGGCQAGHSVVTPDGRHHTFSQFGAGTFHDGVRTHLSRFVLVNPINMMAEAVHLHEVGVQDAWERTTVSPEAVIVTPFHRELNRLTVQANNGPSNSCGMGIGVARHFHLNYGDSVLLAGDITDHARTVTKLRFLQTAARQWAQATALKLTPILLEQEAIDTVADWYARWPVEIRDIDLNDYEAIVFEGAQGVLLDELHGENGFNTWTDCTFRNAYKLLADSEFQGKTQSIGVIRTYSTRHGAGPFIEDPAYDYPEPHNVSDGFQGAFRRGPFSQESVLKAITVLDGIDWLAINHLDVHPWWPSNEVLAELPKIVGRGPTYKDRTFTQGFKAAGRAI